MAVDSPKDLLSVRDGSTIDSCRSSVDPRERHIVCKLDRYQLEDRYLRLLDEVQSLKKSSNTQEDKIKRLATKLMRATANPRACITALDISNDKDRISVLEAENSKLKDKISVLRSQLLNRKHLSRSLCGSRRAPGGTSSGATTCRSDIVRLKSSSCHCGLQSGNDANDVQNYTLKIEELEAQKKELKEKNVELQGELESYVSGNQREKVAENVEYIRLWRQMKQQTEQLVKVQKENKDLISLVNEMKKQVDEAVSNNAEVTAALVAERKKLSIMDEQMVKAKDSELSLREKDERIRDLMNELAILQQHNEELIKLSSKFGKMENENSEIKKRYTEHLSECQVLKSALSNEQANIAALQAANEQLLGKLHEYQILIDKLTIERMGTPAKTKAPAEYVEKKTSSTSTIGDVVVDYQECHKCCESSKDYRDKGIQTIDGTRRFAEQRTQTEECNSGFDQNQDDIRDSLIRGYCNQPSHRSPNVRNGNSALSRERMLKLLEQAQINTPLEAQNPIRIRQMETSGGRGPRLGDTHQREPSRSDRTNDNFMEYSRCKCTMTERIKVINCKGTIRTGRVDANNNVEMYPCYTMVGKCDQDIKKCCTDENENVICPPMRNALQKNWNSCNLLKKRCITFGSLIAPMGSIIDEICPSIQKSFDAIYTAREVHEQLGNNHFKSWQCFTKLGTNKTLPTQMKCNSVRINGDEQKLNSPGAACIKNDTCDVKFRRSDSGDIVDSSKITSSPMLITEDQGLVEIHVDCLQFSNTALEILVFDNGARQASLFLSCLFCDQDRTFTPLIKFPCLNFNSSCVYRIYELSKFFDCILHDNVIFQVHMAREDQVPNTIAQTQLNVKDILDYPQNKMHYIAPVQSTISGVVNTNFGQLSMWVRLSCDLKQIENFRLRRGLEGKPNYMKNESNENLRKNLGNLPKTEKISDLKEDCTQTSNHSISTVNEEIDDMWGNESPRTEIHAYRDDDRSNLYRIYKIREESLDDLSDVEPYEKNSISTISEEDENTEFEENDNQDQTNTAIPDSHADEDVSSKSNLPGQSFNDTDNIAETEHLEQNDIPQDTIVIEIVSLHLTQDAVIFLQNKDVPRLYIEYTFLGKSGIEMESSSVNVPVERDVVMTYHFTQKFKIDEDEHPSQREILSQMLANEKDSRIVFVIVGEPLDEETDEKDCTEIGCAEFDIRQCVITDERNLEAMLTITGDNDFNIGLLKISVNGLEAMKTCIPQSLYLPSIV